MSSRSPRPRRRRWRTVNELRELWSSGTGRLLVWILIGLVAVTAAGMVILWPGERPEANILAPSDSPIETAEVIAVRAVPCPNENLVNCREIEFRLDSGPDSGDVVTMPTNGTLSDLDYQVGDRLRVAKPEDPFVESPNQDLFPTSDESDGAPPSVAPASTAAQPTYSVVDFDRSLPMLWLVVAFAVLTLLVGGIRGAVSLSGLAISLGVVVGFIVPAILAGGSPLAVAVIGAFAIMLATIALTHGLGVKSLSAIFGTASALLLTAGLAVLFVELASITGISSEDAVLLHLDNPGVSLEGLVLAGTVIAALGVLDDVTISQASVVLALRRANPSLRLRSVFTRSLSVGRDHVAATVNTLVLAYVGASLPILLIFGTRGVGLIDAANSEVVAENIVGTLVGSIGLVAAVPFTTLIAAFLSTRVSLVDDELAEEILADGALHAHAH